MTENPNYAREYSFTEVDTHINVYGYIHIYVCTCYKEPELES